MVVVYQSFNSSPFIPVLSEIPDEGAAYSGRNSDISEKSGRVLSGVRIHRKYAKWGCKYLLPQCGALLIRRTGGIFIEHLDNGVCSKCGKAII
jgi:predicted RNA-binding Zn-ribbon protein involved in translation (DUF1610 family)